MHPLQRRSLFAILTIAESAIQQMRSILAQGDDDVGAPTAPKPYVAPPQNANGAYLSEQQEDENESELERMRLQWLQEDAKQEKRMREIWGVTDAESDAGFEGIRPEDGRTGVQGPAPRA